MFMSQVYLWKSWNLIVLKDTALLGRKPYLQALHMQLKCGEWEESVAPTPHNNGVLHTSAVQTLWARTAWRWDLVPLHLFSLLSPTHTFSNLSFLILWHEVVWMFMDYPSKLSLPGHTMTYTDLREKKFNFVLVYTFQLWKQELCYLDLITGLIHILQV